MMAFLFWTAQVARKESDGILTKFKKIDHSLTETNDSGNKQRANTAAIETDRSYPAELALSFRTNKILFAIDSIKNDLLLVTDRDQAVSFSLKDKEKLRTLKIDLLDYKSFIQKSFSDKPGIELNDFIDVTDKTNGTAAIPWEIYYFKNANFYSATTLLTCIHQKVVTLHQKAIKSN